MKFLAMVLAKYSSYCTNQQISKPRIEMLLFFMFIIIILIQIPVEFKLKNLIGATCHDTMQQCNTSSNNYVTSVCWIVFRQYKVTIAASCTDKN
jgi:DNA integrity scanning protein DisA with diadenylate cyclase activity